KANFLDGPTYIENKSDIQSIKFASGRKEEFGPAKTPLTIISTTTSATPITITETTPTSSTPTPTPDDPKVSDKKDTDDYYTKNTDTDDYYSKPENVAGNRSGKLSISKKKFKQNDNVITEQEFHNILKQTNDKEIMALVAKSGRAKKRQYIAFSCIFGGSILIVVYLPAFLILEPVPIILFYINKSSRNTCNKKAMELYNKR
nr:hypothetical protein [Bacteroidota bacterium]